MMDGCYDDDYDYGGGSGDDEGEQLTLCTQW